MAVGESKKHKTSNLDMAVGKKKKRKTRAYKVAIQISPLEIISHNNFNNVVVENTNEIVLNLDVTIHHLTEYWVLLDDDDDDNDDHKMMIASLPSATDNPIPSQLPVYNIFAVATTDKEDDNNDVIMPLLCALDVLYESYVVTEEELEELKRKIIGRITEAKAHVLQAKPAAVQARVDISHIVIHYFESDTDATSAASVARERSSINVSTKPAVHSNGMTFHDQVIKPASRSWMDLSETKIFGPEDLIFHNHQISSGSSTTGDGCGSNGDSSSSLICGICLEEFRMGVDLLIKLPCCHSFHFGCINAWFLRRNTCPNCCHELPAWKCFVTD